MSTPRLVCRPSLLLALSLATALSACAPTPEDDDPRAAPAAIINGTAVSSPETSGVVWLANDVQAVTCTGTLLTNDWVITASHCGLNIQDPSRIQVYMGNYQPDYGSRPNFRRAAYAVNHPGQDFALIRLAQALPMPAQPYNGNEYRQGFFTGSSDELVTRRLTLHAMGYGNSFCNANGCDGRGNLRDAWLRTRSPPSSLPGVPALNFDVESNALGQITGAADSGSPIFLENTAGRFLAGVLKGGNQSSWSFYGRSENVRDWALAYIYGRPVPLPRAWYVPPAVDSNVLAQAYPFCRTQSGLSVAQQMVLCAAFPLQSPPHNYAQRVTFQPCPGATSYTWSATYDLERIYDAITVSNSLGSAVLTGVGSTSGVARGDFTLGVQTNATVQSAGLTSLTFTCDNRVRFPNPWASPLPTPMWASTYWNPCPGNETYTYTVDYSFPGSSGATIGGRGISGTGTLTVPGARGTLPVQVFANAGSSAPGIRSLTAVCDAAIHCHGPTCFTSPSVLPHSRVMSVAWTPCNGRPFTMSARYDMEPGYDYVTISRPDATLLSLTGRGTATAASSVGTVTVRVTTDGSVSSNGLQELSARCNDW